MNPSRVKRLIVEGQLELTKKLFKRLTYQGVDFHQLAHTLAASEFKDEDVLAYPDFTFQMGAPGKVRERDYICVQTADGRTVRVVAYFDFKQQKDKKK
jgi:hypothetical protein